MAQRRLLPHAPRRPLAAVDPQPEQLDRGEYGGERAESERDAHEAEYVARRQCAAGRADRPRGREREAQEPPRHPHSSEDPAGDRELPGHDAPIACRTATEPAVDFAERHDERAREVEDPPDPRARQPDGHRQCPFL